MTTDTNEIQKINKSEGNGWFSSRHTKSKLRKDK